MFFFREGFTYRNFLMDALAIFLFIVWFWLLITVASDLFRRHDISGWVKAIWVIGWIVFPYIAVLAYLIFQGRTAVWPITSTRPRRSGRPGGRAGRASPCCGPPLAGHYVPPCLFL